MEIILKILMTLVLVTNAIIMSMILPECIEKSKRKVDIDKSYILVNFIVQILAIIVMWMV